MKKKLTDCTCIFRCILSFIGVYFITVGKAPGSIEEPNNEPLNTTEHSQQVSPSLFPCKFMQFIWKTLHIVFHRIGPFWRVLIMLMELIAQEVKAYKSQRLCVLVFNATFQQYFSYTLPVIQILLKTQKSTF